MNRQLPNLALVPKRQSERDLEDKGEKSKQVPKMATPCSQKMSRGEIARMHGAQIIDQ